jgi:hypothetical protein
MDFSDHKAQQASGNESYSTGETASTNQAFTKLDGLVDRFAKDHGVSKETAAQVLANASASVETGVGFNESVRKDIFQEGLRKIVGWSLLF